MSPPRSPALSAWLRPTARGLVLPSCGGDRGFPAPVNAGRASRTPRAVQRWASPGLGCAVREDEGLRPPPQSLRAKASAVTAKASSLERRERHPWTQPRGGFWPKPCSPFGASRRAEAPSRLLPAPTWVPRGQVLGGPPCRSPCFTHAADRPWLTDGGVAGQTWPVPLTARAAVALAAPGPGPGP